MYFFYSFFNWLFYGLQWTYFVTKWSLFLGLIRYFLYKKLNLFFARQLCKATSNYGKNYASKMLLEKKDFNTLAVTLLGIHQLFDQEQDNFSILDVGCGNGLCLTEIYALFAEKLLLNEIKDKTLRLVGVDHSKFMIEESNDILTNFYDKLQVSADIKSKVTVEFLETLPSNDQTFDLLLCFNVIQTIKPSKLREFVEDISVKLKSGGKIAFTFQCYETDLNF